jgi:PTH2 family peptidyl-tRNA hydrolase
MNTKQVIVIRKDLNMRKGKMIAQGAHASMKVFFDRGKLIKNSDEHPNMFICEFTEPMREWCAGIFTKICLSVNSETELLDIYRQAQEVNLPCSLIQDCGLTEFNGIPTYTAVAIGPDYGERVDLITGHLPLL